MKFYKWLDTQDTTEDSLYESIKSEIDKLGADTMKRAGKIITLTWKSGSDIAALKQKIAAALKVFKDKIKFIGTEKLGSGIKAEIEMI